MPSYLILAEALWDIFIYKIRKLKLKELKQIVQGYTASI